MIFYEVLEQAHPISVAFFGMKLGAHDVPVLHGRDDRKAVVCVGQHILLVIAHHMVGMHEVESRLFGGQLAEQAVVSGHGYRVPAHVGDFEFVRVSVEAEADRVGGNPAQARLLAFFARTRQKLHPEANAEHRRFFLQDGFV